MSPAFVLQNMIFFMLALIGETILSGFLKGKFSRGSIDYFAIMIEYI